MHLGEIWGMAEFMWWNFGGLIEILQSYQQLQIRKFWSVRIEAYVICEALTLQL